MADGISKTRYDYKIALLEAIQNGDIVPVAFERCPLCLDNRSSLYCDTCVNEGQITHRQRNSGT